MVNHTTTYLCNSNIFAWSLLNEPWGIQYTQSFIDLIQRESALVKSITNKPVTIRFVSSSTYTTQVDGNNYMYNHFVRVWNWDQRVFDALDFIGLNCYIKYPELYETWVNITAENVNGIAMRGKQVLITEFGYKSDDDNTQVNYFKKSIDAFNTMNLAGCIAWSWEQFDGTNLGKGYNLLGDDQGNPRPAYQELLKFDS
jgi:hypothetical protein